MSERADRLAALMPDAGIDALLVSSIKNVGWVTGFTGSSGLALVGAQVRELLTDFRYVTQAEEEVSAEFERRTAPRDLLDELEQALPAGELRLGFEEAHISVRLHGRLRELLPARVELVAVSGLVERLRAVKEPREVGAIQAAAALADEAFARVVLRDGLIGRTETEVALALEHEMRLLGARRPSFDSVVAGGPHGALPHADPRDVPIERGGLVVVDWGAQLDGYCSDCTRTVAAGVPDERAREIYQLVLDAQIAGLEAVRAGAAGVDVDAVAREMIAAAGYGEQFGHGLGHGVGIEVHEAPRLATSSEDVLEDGHIVTVEPGIYLPGEVGVRIEDLVVVRDGGAEVLTSISKELTEI